MNAKIRYIWVISHLLHTGVHITKRSRLVSLLSTFKLNVKCIIHYMSWLLLWQNRIFDKASVFMPILADYSYHVKTGHDSLCSCTGSRGSLRTPILWFEILFHNRHDSSLTYQLEHRCTVSLGMEHDTEQCQTLKARAAKFTLQFSMSSSSVGLWILFIVFLRLLAGGWTKLPVHSFVRHETWHRTKPNP